MFMLFVYAAPILLVCVIFGYIASAIFPSKPHELNSLEVDRIVAKNNGFVLHNLSYENGREIYVLPEYRNVSYNAVRSSIRKDGTLGCYQKKLYDNF